ncbi:hypothetical protein Efla_006842 [Eimeria flavescens]
MTCFFNLKVNLMKEFSAFHMADTALGAPTHCDVFHLELHLLYGIVVALPSCFETGGPAAALQQQQQRLAAASASELRPQDDVSAQSCLDPSMFSPMRQKPKFLD